MSAPEYNDITTDPPNNHNQSSQHDVVFNADPALNVDKEHHHGHLHHSANAEKGREDKVVYSKGTTFEKSTIPHQDPQDHALHRRAYQGDSKRDVEVADAEQDGLSPISSEEDPQTHTFSSFYSRYRIFFHLFVWLLFTGYVKSRH